MLLHRRLRLVLFRPPVFVRAQPSSNFVLTRIHIGVLAHARFCFQTRCHEAVFLHAPSSVLHAPSSVLRPPSSVLRPPSSVLRPPCSVLPPLYLDPPSRDDLPR